MAEDDEERTSVVLLSETLNKRIKRAGSSSSCLLLLSGPSNIVGKQWFLNQKESSLGRSSKATFFIEDKSLSRIHVKFFVSEEDGKVSIADIGSTNKTLLNGKELSPFNHEILKNNDQIQMGNIVLKFLEKGNLEILSAGDTFQRSLTDPLTQIYNKRALKSKGEEMFQKPFSSQSMGVVVFDVDHFKKINDTYGHSAGDYVLKKIAHLTQYQLNSGTDFFARWGGEEFCVLTTRNSLTRVKNRAENIRINVKNHIFEYDKKRFSVTISLGVALRSKEDSSWESLFEKADKALYESKKQGRNRTTLAA